MARKLTRAQARDEARRRPPIRITGVEPDGENIVINARGEMRASHRVFIHPDDVGALREGYYCANCLEPQAEPFPLHCWLCGFPMRDKQAEFLAKGYQGNMRLGPQTDADTEMAAMAEWHERQQREKDQRSAASQILLPGKDF